MGKLRFGILGAGHIATKSVAPAILHSKKADLVAVASRDQARGEILAGSCRCKVFRDYDSMLRDSDIDCVYITLPNSLHAEWAIKAAKNKKHIICEKPAFCSFNEAEQVLEVCKQNGVRFLEGYMFRFHPQHDHVRALIQSGILGEVFHFQANFGIPKREPNDIRMSSVLKGGAFNDLGGYLVSASRLIFNGEPDHAEGILHIGMEEQVDLHGMVQLKFYGKYDAQLTFGFDHFYRNEYTVWGSKGVVQVNRAFSIPPNYKPEVCLYGEKKEREFIDIPAVDQFELMIDRFCEAIQSPLKIDFEKEALLQAKTMEQIRQSRN